MSKTGKAVEYRTKIGQLEDIFEEVLDQAKKRFDQTDSQLQQIVEFLDAERKTKTA